jgi:hypothetical protein
MLGKFVDHFSLLKTAGFWKIAAAFFCHSELKSNFKYRNGHSPSGKTRPSDSYKSEKIGLSIKNSIKKTTVVVLSKIL